MTPDKLSVQQRLSRELQALHRILLRREAAAAALPGDPHRLLAAAMNDPRLAWLRPMLTLIVELDDADDAGCFADSAGCAVWHGRIRQFLGHEDPADPEFRCRYVDWIERSVDIRAIDERIRLLLTELSTILHN